MDGSHLEGGEKFDGAGFLLKAHEVPFRMTMQMSRAVVQPETNQLGAPNNPAVRYGDSTLFAGEVKSLIHICFQNK